MTGKIDNKSTVYVRYALMQLPGLALVASVLVALDYFINPPLWVPIAVIAGWVAKDLAMFPFVKHAYSGGISGSESLMPGIRGMRGKVLSSLSPVGSVRVRGEIWQARHEGRGTIIECGKPVRVKEINGMMLLVEPYCDNEPAIEDKKES